ncbi:MAG: PAS domain S-box protein, partial [Candidatus Neomarinimicrobiota bacterium]
DRIHRVIPVDDRLRSQRLPTVTTILRDSRNQLWFVGEAGIWQWNGSSGDTLQLRAMDLPDTLGRIYCLREDKDSRFWIGTSRGLVAWNPETHAIRGYRWLGPDQKRLSVNQIIVLDGGRLLLSLQNQGVALFQPRSGSIRFFYHDPRDERSLGYNTINTLFRDGTGMIWIGFWGEGADRLWLHSPFTSFGWHADDSRGLSHSSIRAILETKSGELWVGSYGGLDRFARPGGPRVQTYAEKEGLVNRNVYCLMAGSGGLWIGTEGGGLHHLNVRSGHIRSFRLPGEENNGDNLIFAMAADRDSLLWLGTARGIRRFDLKKEQYLDRGFSRGDSGTLPNDKVNAILHTGKETWIGTDHSGLIRFRRSGESLSDPHRFVRDPARKSGLQSDRILCLMEDRRGRIWIGTEEGLHRYLPDEQHFRHWDHEDGLPNNVVYRILEDTRGRLWLSTNQGLSCFDPETESFRNFSELDGLPGNEFNRGAAYRDRDGRLFFGGINGLVSFTPDSVLNRNTSPRVTITRMATSTSLHSTVQNGKQEYRYFPDYRVQLSSVPFQLEFSFSGLDFRPPSFVEYAYRLQGIQPKWRILSNGDHRVTYTHLPPGTYRLEVKARDIFSQEYGPSTTLEFVIPVPLWKSMPALVVYGLLFATLAWGVGRNVRRRNQLALRRSQLEIDRLRKMESMQRETIRNQERYHTLFEQSMDPIFIMEQDGTIVETNRSFQQMFPEAATSVQPLSLFTMVPDRDRQTQLQHRLESDGRVKDFPLEIPRPDSTVLYCLLSLQSIRESTSARSQMQGILRDITAQVERDREIQRLSHGIEAAGESILMTDKDGVIQYANPSFYRLTGYTSAEILGKTPRILKSGLQGKDFYQRMWETIRGGHRWSGLITNRKKDGSLYNANLTIAPLKDEGGDVTGYIAIHTDITQRIQLEDALRSSEQKYRRLSQKLIHIQDKERERISRDLHDSLGQFLATISIHMDMLASAVIPQMPDFMEKISHAKRLIQNAIEECRRLSFELNPLSLQRLGLPQAIRELIRTVPAESKLKINFEENISRDRLNPDLEMAIYRILQEALSNIIKYAEASQVD